ncbi:hypothetical protein Tco_1457191 [Tanacetum coccineum]
MYIRVVQHGDYHLFFYLESSAGTILARDVGPTPVLLVHHLPLLIVEALSSFLRVLNHRLPPSQEVSVWRSMLGVAVRGTRLRARSSSSGLDGTVEVGIGGCWWLSGLITQMNAYTSTLHEHLEQIMTITRSGMTPEAIEELINQRVAEALAAYEANHAVESQSQNGDGYDNGNIGGNGNGNGGGNKDRNGGGNGNGNGGGNGNGNPNRNDRGAMPVARECTYHDFVKCQPLNFKRTEGVVGLTRWFEKMETVFHISNCPEKYQVKYATCTLLNSELTWWNAHKRIIRDDAAFSMS